jgi:hypothetical protein
MFKDAKPSFTVTLPASISSVDTQTSASGLIHSQLSSNTDLICIKIVRELTPMNAHDFLKPNSHIFR